MKELILFRHVSGAGSTTLANNLCDAVFAADDYFTDENGEYHFNVAELGNAHFSCVDRTAEAMQNGVDRIGVTNTFATEKEMDSYFLLAEKWNYRISCVIVENRHGSKDIHNVPPEIRLRQANRLKNSIKLI